MESFTGHAFCRTSAAIVADSGASMLSLKRHGRWKSDRVAQGYVEKSKSAQLEVASIISAETSTSSLASETSSSSNLSAAVSSSVATSTPLKSGFYINNLTLNNCVVSFTSS